VRRSLLVIGAVLAAAVFGLYAWRVGEAPVYLSPDEAIIAVDAHTLAATGHDVVGERLPLYFRIQMPGETRWGWFTPAIFYFTALVLKVFPLSERVVRLPTVCVGVADVVLLYWVGWKIFKREGYALCAAGLLALAPAHFILSRYALDYLYPLPFMLGWLLCLLLFLESGRLSWLFASTLCLGVGFYSYIAAVLLMAMYLGFTGVVLLLTRRTLRAYAAAAAGFALPLLPFAIWFLKHPTVLSDTAARYDLYDARKLNALQGIREFLSYTNLERLSSLYWTYFSPSFLFFSGDGQITFSTRSVGVLLMPLALLVACGFYQVIVRRPSIANLLVVIGFVSAPAAAVLVPEPAAIIRAVALLPFAALLAAFGLELLWTAPGGRPAKAALVVGGASLLAVGLSYGIWMLAARGRIGASTPLLIAAGGAVLASAWVARPWAAGRLLACALIALVPIQFARFSADYFGDYRVRVNSWLGGNLRGALEQLIARSEGDRASRIYFATLQSTAGLLDTRNRWMDAYWRFYLGKHGREDLLDRSAPLDATDVRTLPAHSLVLANDGDLRLGALVKGGELRLVASIPELDREPFFLILERP
jgi:4-amino-4-deoxy-L-arabinose transferase-like glycosyltransferase